MPTKRVSKDQVSVVRKVEKDFPLCTQPFALSISSDNIFSLISKLMLDTWNESIFKDIKQRLQDCAMKLVYSERNGEAFDSQLVIGVRESYGMGYLRCKK
jgi:hypothetical protein